MSTFDDELAKARASRDRQHQEEEERRERNQRELEEAEEALERFLEIMDEREEEIDPSWYRSRRGVRGWVIGHSHDISEGGIEIKSEYILLADRRVINSGTRGNMHFESPGQSATSFPGLVAFLAETIIGMGLDV
jgi:hypothetical protein